MTMILTAVQEVGVEASDGTLYIGRKALNDALYGISGLDGLIGDIDCDENGDCGFALAIAVLQVQDGEFVQVN
jgi:branched-chain amino acid transport system substrate-binding protein